MSVSYCGDNKIDRADRERIAKVKRILGGD